MKTIIAAFLLVSTALPAFAQYYTPGYGPPPGYYRRPPVIGGQCDVYYRNPYGRRRHYICPIRDPKPVGLECACPPPPEYGPGPFLPGRTIY